MTATFVVFGSFWCVPVVKIYACALLLVLIALFILTYTTAIPISPVQFLCSLLRLARRKPTFPAVPLELISLHKRLEFHPEDGSGVFSGLLRGAPVAIKVLPLGPPENRAALIRDISNAYALRGDPRVLPILGAALTDSQALIVSELSPRGSILDVMAESPTFTDGQRRDIARGAAAALAHLHAQGVVHGAVSSMNFLMGNDGAVRVGDYGLARKRSWLLRWSAPESVRRGEYSSMSDVWMFGCFLLELLTGEEPFAELKMTEAMRALMTEPSPVPGVVRGRSPYGIADIMRRCWDINPLLRPTMQRVHQVLQRSQ